MNAGVGIGVANAERQPLVERNDPTAADEEVEHHPGLQIDGVERAAAEPHVAGIDAEGLLPVPKVVTRMSVDTLIIPRSPGANSAVE